jgi:hypothetical protein
MAQFEYLKIDLSTHHPRSNEIELLNEAGRQGWRLVCIAANMMAYLVREIEEPPQRRKRRKEDS